MAFKLAAIALTLAVIGLANANDANSEANSAVSYDSIGDVVRTGGQKCYYNVQKCCEERYKVHKMCYHCDWVNVCKHYRALTPSEVEEAEADEAVEESVKTYDRKKKRKDCYKKKCYKKDCSTYDTKYKCGEYKKKRHY